MPKRFGPELRDRAAHTVYDRQVLEGGPRSESIRAVAPQLGVDMESLRIWCNRYGPIEASPDTGTSLEEEHRRLRRELAESRWADERPRAGAPWASPVGVSAVNVMTNYAEALSARSRRTTSAALAPSSRGSRSSSSPATRAASTRV